MAESEFERIREDYLHRLRRQLRRVPASLQDDAIHEVEAHIEDASKPAPGDVANLQGILEKLGPPEEYGRELGLQLVLQANRKHPSIGLLIWIGVFWASSSIIGAFVVMGSILLYILGFCFLIGGVVGLLDPASTITIFRINDTVVIPSFWPPLNILIGAAILYFLTLGLIFLARRWSVSRLNRRVLATTMKQETVAFPQDWDRRITWAILMIAMLGLLSCIIFSAVGGLFPLGNKTVPDGYFKNPIAFLAFLGGVAALLSPVLGILWVLWREKRKDRQGNGGPSQEKNEIG